ncbi:MAG: hypothetical protein HKM04_08310 [Legionellales bacterium]|nr:hypothetical protein [Legionellales bacterium]
MRGKTCCTNAQRSTISTATLELTIITSAVAVGFSSVMLLSMQIEAIAYDCGVNYNHFYFAKGKNKE